MQGPINPFFIAIPIWAASLIYMLCYLFLFYAGRLTRHMKEFHSQAWRRINRRWWIFRQASWLAYEPPRKGAAPMEIVWCWRRPLRDQELSRLADITRMLGLVTLCSMAASLLAASLFDNYVIR
jgi:hypothetical protein